MNKDDCIFCKIANGEIPSATVYEDSICRVILDVNPANKGHALIIPKEHFDNIYSMDAETAAKIFTIATEVAKAQKARQQARLYSTSICILFQDTSRTT